MVVTEDSACLSVVKVRTCQANSKLFMNIFPYVFIIEV